jgi:nucleoid-associated protein YgaU
VNRQTYTVKTGDTFYGIAQDQLGDASRWQEIFDLNKDVVHGDPKRLQVGHVLVLPD